MSTATTVRTAESVLGGERIISADSHVIEPADFVGEKFAARSKGKISKVSSAQFAGEKQVLRRVIRENVIKLYNLKVNGVNNQFIRGQNWRAPWARAPHSRRLQSDRPKRGNRRSNYRRKPLALLF